MQFVIQLSEEISSSSTFVDILKEHKTDTVYGRQAFHVS